MGITQLIDNFYEKIPYHRGKPENITSGQIAWVPTLIHLPHMTVMDFERATNETHTEVIFTARRIKSGDFSRAKNNKVPVPNLPVAETEEYILNRAKKRPCILIAKASLGLDKKTIENLTDKRSHLLVEDCIFIPIYSAATQDFNSGFPQKLTYRIKHFHYTHLLFLPQKPTYLRSEAGLAMHEGVARLDRVFAIATNPTTIELTDIKIHEDYLKLINFHLKEYFLNETEPLLTEYRELLATEFNPSLI